MAELVVALDAPDAASALELARGLRGLAPWVKVGLELFTAEGPRMVGELKGMGFSVFLDLKFLDIPNTVRGAVHSATRLGADMLTLHVLGGERMAQAAIQGRQEGLDGGRGPLLMGVTLLTSMASGELPLGAGADPAALVLDLSTKAEHYRMDGIVCSGQEVAEVRRECGPGLRCLTPGIRPAGTDAQDQRRAVTPAAAVAAGADYLVVGRPITAAKDPAAAAQAILDEMAGASEAEADFGM